jgi:hypothetical protein
MKTYEQMHAGLHWARGRASEHLCACGKPAKHWAYLYTASEQERVAEDGSRYSESFEDYAPMCISCHRSFDFAHSDNVQAAWEERQKKGDGWRVLEQRRQSDPVLASRLGAIRGANGRVAMSKINAVVRTCVCGLPSTPAGVGTHQKSSGHIGYVDA